MQMKLLYQKHLREEKKSNIKILRIGQSPKGKYKIKYIFLEGYMNRKNILNLILGKYENEEKIDEELLRCIREAIIEIEVAQSMFNDVSDPKLVEAAIYREDAAKRKFEYLISLAKEKGLGKIIER